MVEVYQHEQTEIIEFRRLNNVTLDLVNGVATANFSDGNIEFLEFSPHPTLPAKIETTSNDSNQLSEEDSAINEALSRCWNQYWKMRTSPSGQTTILEITYNLPKIERRCIGYRYDSNGTNPKEIYEDEHVNGNLFTRMLLHREQPLLPAKSGITLLAQRLFGKLTSASTS